MKIGIANDMRMMREILRRIISASPDHEVLWTANDGREVVENCRRELPDLILMDLIMPVMDGVEATRQIMAATPCQILVVTASVGVNSSKVYEAMSCGALDATKTPIGLGNNDEAVRMLLSKIENIGRLTSTPAPAKKAPPPPAEVPREEESLPGLLAIGASTGGPKAIASILSQLEIGFPAAVIVIQHIDQDFAGGLAQWLNTQTPLEVKIAQRGSLPTPGKVWLAGSNDHLILGADGRFRYTPHPVDTAYRPSVDVFFESLVPIRLKKLTAVLLTGMGPDGASGMLSLRRAGHHTIAQDEATCVIYGMPQAAARMNAAVEILPLSQIPIALNKLWKTATPHRHFK